MNQTRASVRFILHPSSFVLSLAGLSMWLSWLWLGYVLLVLFILGSAVGSFLNVCIARLPRGMSLLRPGSHCFACKHPIALRHNLPLLSYWLLGGRCRYCGATFSVRYFCVELFAGLASAGLFVLFLGLDALRFLPPGMTGFDYLESGRLPQHGALLFGFAVLQFFFLLVAGLCNLENGRVPASVLVLGLAVAFTTAALCPWPWPHSTPQAVRSQSDIPWPPDRRTVPLPGLPRGPMPRTESWSGASISPQTGLQPWPVWGPLPDALDAAGWPLGVATTLAGLVVGACLGLLLRLLPGSPPSSGDAALFALAGSFTAWQPITCAFLAVGLVASLGRLCRFAPASSDSLQRLALGLFPLAAWLGWPWVAGFLYRFFFRPEAPALVALLCLAGLAAGWRHPVREPEPGPQPSETPAATV
jgi:leader peptidase (prepilin peptidase)/N-methyltransferase